VITAGASSKKSTSKISVSFTDKKGKKVNNKISQKLKELEGTSVDVSRKTGQQSVEQIDVDGSDDICNDSTVDSRN
jgi:5S rRNA maturation endonuclease (ribonuclease M5)